MHINLQAVQDQELVIAKYEVILLRSFFSTTHSLGVAHVRTWILQVYLVTEKFHNSILDETSVLYILQTESLAWLFKPVSLMLWFGFTGVDMSESALKTAQALLSEALGSSMPLFFHTSDMLSFLKQTLATYDIVLAAFALHHLTTEDKTEVPLEETPSPILQIMCIAHEIRLLTSYGAQCWLSSTTLHQGRILLISVPTILRFSWNEASDQYVFLNHEDDFWPAKSCQEWSDQLTLIGLV